MFRVGDGLDIFAVWRPVANSEHAMLPRGKIELKRVPSGDFDVQFLLLSAAITKSAKFALFAESGSSSISLFKATHGNAANIAV